MKKSTLILQLLVFSGIMIAGCKKDGDNDDNNNNPIPDAVFNMTVSGAESYTFNFTMPGSGASDNVVNGSQQNSVQMFAMVASSIPITWQYSLVADMNSLASGTYNIIQGASTFIPPSQSTAYTAVSGTITITKATLYQSVSSIEDWFIDGTFSGTYQDSNPTPNEVTISGSFSGVNIKTQ